VLVVLFVIWCIVNIMACCILICSILFVHSGRSWPATPRILYLFVVFLLYITVGHGPRRQEDARRRSDYFRTGQEHGWNSRGSAYVYVCVCVCMCVYGERENYISVEREKERER
jgi:hypothetical protein